jgi:hypothetical protein
MFVQIAVCDQELRRKWYFWSVCYSVFIYPAHETFSSVLATYQVCLTHCNFTCIVLLVTATRAVPSTCPCTDCFGIVTTPYLCIFSHIRSSKLHRISVILDTGSQVANVGEFNSDPYRSSKPPQLYSFFYVIILNYQWRTEGVGWGLGGSPPSKF